MLTDRSQVVRPVSLSVVAIAASACAMAVNGWQQVSLMLGGILVLMAALLLMQVWREVSRLSHHGRSAHRAAAQAERHYVDVLRRILKIVEAHEQYSHGHSERVGALAKNMARHLGLDRDRCILLGLAGELHDIGLLAIPEGLLKKRCQLGAHDFRTIQTHSETSYEILKPLRSLADVLPGIRYHHERMNGTGYPAGLRGEQIPIEARILAAADAYDAMTHDRPHRCAISPLEAVRELQRCSPDGYDSECVAALTDLMHVPKMETEEAPAVPVA